MKVLAARGAELARVSEAAFDLSVAGSGSDADALISHAEVLSSDVLTVELTLRRELSEVAVLERVVSLDADGNPVLDGDGNTVFVEVQTGTTRAESATLRVTPETGRATDLIVEFAQGSVRRGLRFQQLAAGGSCSALGTGWRLPNFAEASGLLWDGNDVTLRTGARVEAPGLSGSELALSLPAAGSEDSPALALDAVQTDLIGLDALAGNAAAQVAAVRTTVGATIGITGAAGDSSAQVVCVRPDDESSYAQPADPAGVCLLPDCAAFGALNGAAGAATTVTLLAWRYDSTGQTVSAGDGYDLNLRALGDVAANEIGSADGRLTAELVAPPEGVAVGETAAFELSPEFGAVATLRFGPALAFGDAELIGGESAFASVAEVFPPRVAVEYLGARRGLTYVRSSSALANDAVFALCRAGGEGWRAPGIGELAGLFADGDEGRLTDSGDVGVGATVYANDILPGARRGVRIPFAAALAEDAAALSDGGVSHYADAVQADGRAQAFRVLTADGGAVQVSLSLDEGRGVCVLAADGYARPAALSGTEVLDADVAGSAELERRTFGGEVFHRVGVSVWRNAQGETGVVREDSQVSLSAELSGAAASLFAAAVSGPNVDGVLNVEISQSRPLVYGERALTLALFPPVGITATLLMTVSVPEWTPLSAEVYAAEGFAGTLQAFGDGADDYGLTLRASVAAESGLTIVSGGDASEFAVAVSEENPLGRTDRLAAVEIAESASGDSATLTLSFAARAVYAPLPETHQGHERHVAEFGEQFIAQTRYVDGDLADLFAPSDAGARVSIAGVAGGDAALFELDADYYLRLVSPAATPAGGYEATLHFSHPGFLGTVTAVVPADVYPEDAAVLPFNADDFVPVRAHEIYAAAGYVGPILTVSLTAQPGARFADATLAADGDSLAFAAVNDEGLILSVPPSQTLAAGEVRVGVLRASVHSPTHESGRLEVTAQLRGLVSQGGEGSLSVEEDLAAWTYSGFADILPEGEVLISLAQGGDLFTLSAEGTLSLLPDVDRATLEALLGAAETTTALAEINAHGDAFLGAHGALALIRIYGERINPTNPADFSPAFLRETTIIVAPDFARDALNTGTESFSLTVLYPPGPGWRLDVVYPSPAWDATGAVRESDGAAGHRIGYRSFGSGAPRGGETLTREIVFAGFYPEGYVDPDNGLRSQDGALTLRLAVSAVAEIPTGRVEYGATTRVSTLVDSASGGTIVYDGFADSLAAYSEVSLRLAPPDGAGNDGDVLRLFDLDSQGRVVWTPTLFAEDDDFARHLDSRALERFGFQAFLVAVDALSPDYLGALRLTAQVLFRSGVLAGTPKLPDGIPETGDIAGGYDAAGQANCVALGGRVVDTPEPGLAALLGDAYINAPELYTRCADLDNYGSECEFGVEGCGDFFARVRNCNAQNRPSHLIGAAAQAANPNVAECGSVCEDGLSARGRDCNILTFYGQEIQVDAASQIAVIGPENHLGGADVNATFEGARRGLWVMSVPAEAGHPSFGIAGSLRDGNLEGIGDICRDGGAGWRLPTLSEAAGLIYPNAGTEAVVTRDGAGAIPGLDLPSSAHFAADTDGGAALPPPVISGLPALESGTGARFALMRWSGTDLRASSSTSGAGLLHCVRERSGYPALSDFADVRVNGVAVDSSAVATVSLIAAPDIADGAHYGTVTLAAWRYDTSGNVVAATDAFVSHTADPEVVAEEISRSGGEVVVAYRPSAGDSARADVIAHSDTGRRVIVELHLSRLGRVVAPDDVIAAAARDVTVDAAPGFFGPAYAVPVAEGYTLTNPVLTPDGVAVFDAENTVIALAESAAIGGEVARATLAANVVCLTDLPCRPLTITVDLEFAPKPDPGQAALDAVYLDDFALNLNLPDGYANADGRAGRVLTLVGLGGLDDADALAGISLAVDSQNGILEHAPDGDAAGALNAGEYAATIALFESDDDAALGSLLLGTVYLEATIAISQRTPDANEYGLLQLAETVTVAAGEGAVGESIGFVSLTAGADAEALLPADFPGGVSMSLLADSRGAAFYLTVAVESEGVLEGTATLTVSISDNANYTTLERTAEVRISALRQQGTIDAVGRIIDNNPFASGNIAELKTGDYANADI